MNNLKKYISSKMAFSEESWDTLRGTLSIIGLKKNDYLIKEGEVCQAMFYISSGLLRSYYNKDGKEVNTNFYFENEFVSNIKSLISSTKSEYAIIANEASRIIRFDREKIMQAYRRSHQIEDFARMQLFLMMSKQEDHLNSFKLQTPRERYQSLISQHPDFLQRVSLTQTASYLGIRRETLSRLRGQ